MNNVLIRNIIRFVVLVLLQVGVLNQVQLGGFINPYLYILFVIMLQLAWHPHVGDGICGLSAPLYARLADAARDC